MKKIINTLKEFGITEHESALYLAALAGSPCTVIQLGERAKMKRTSVYNFLAGTIKKGLIIPTVVGKKTLYAAIKPEDLAQVIERQKEKLFEIVPELALIHTKSGSIKPKIRFYEGVDGLKTVYNDTLEQSRDSEILGYAVFNQTYKSLPENFIKDYLAERVKRGIRAKGIIVSDDYSVAHVKLNNKELRETILLPAKDFPITNEINIYGDKVAILSFGEEKIGIIIESVSIANTQRAIFNLLWSKLKEN